MANGDEKREETKSPETFTLRTSLRTVAGFPAQAGEEAVRRVLAGESPPVLSPEEEALEALQKDERPLTPERWREAAGILLRGSTRAGIRHYQERVPNWPQVALIELVSRAFATLRGFLDDADQLGVSWAAPAAVLHYEVPWDFEGEGQGRGLRPEVFEFSFPVEPPKTPDELAAIRDASLAASWASVERFLHRSALERVTRFVGYEKHGEELVPIAPPGIKAALDALPEKERAEAWDELLQPTFFEGVSRDLLERDEPPGAPNTEDEDEEPPGLPVAALRFRVRLRKDERLFAPLVVTGEHEGRAFSAALVVGFRPLVVDCDERIAYYPISVALLYRQGEEEGEPDSLLSWPPEDRSALLDDLQKTLETTRRALFPEEEKDAAPAPTVKEKPFPLSFGPALVDSEVLDFVQGVHRVRLPARSWSSLKPWEDLVREEVERLLVEEGDRAGGKESLLRKSASGEWRLNAKGERLLKIREGLGKGFRFREEKNGAEFFSRFFEFRGGYLEAGLSWNGLAGPWTSEWRRKAKKEVEAEEAALQAPSLFDQPNEQALQTLARKTRFLQLAEAGQWVMDAVIRQVGKQGRSLVRFPATAFRTGLQLERDPEWKGRVEGVLEALRRTEFRYRSHGTLRETKGRGSFLLEWHYAGAGPGGHGVGEYLLVVSPSFVGILKAFQSGQLAFKDHEIPLYDFAKTLTEEDRKALGWGSSKGRAAKPQTYDLVDAGVPFYAKAFDLSPEQTSLLNYLGTEITRKGDPLSASWDGEKAPRKNREASEPRLYDRRFCPLLPEGESFVAALGHYRRAAEAGRTLQGSRQRETPTGGAHQGGLLEEALGYFLPSGGASRKREEILRQALADMRRVVVELLGGRVFARDRAGRWITLEEAADLPAEDLGRRTKWAFFLPPDWSERLRDRWEEVQAERAARGETEAAWKVTMSPKQAEDAALADYGELPAAPGAVGLALLRHRLRHARRERGLSQAALAALFGVRQGTLAKWELGPEPDSEGVPRGKPIPPAFVPLLERWITTGEPPSEAELAALEGRRRGL